MYGATYYTGLKLRKAKLVLKELVKDYEKQETLENDQNEQSS
jgi:hypothetical protein